MIKILVLKNPNKNQMSNAMSDQALHWRENEGLGFFF